DGDHPVDGVAAAAANADDLDLGAAPRGRIERQTKILVASKGNFDHVSLRQKNSLKIPRSRPAMRPNVPTPARAGSGTRLRCAYSTRPTGVANVGLFT